MSHPTLFDLEPSNYVKHPAKFPPTVLQAIAHYARSAARVLDPFAGTGLIHQLDADTVGIEIEPEWAHIHPSTIVGNALALPFADASFDAVATSPVYGNRFSDHHVAKDGSSRRSYTHDLGRKLHPDNIGATYFWQPAYKPFYQKAWIEVCRVLKPGGLFVLNISNCIHDHVEQPVTEWHTAEILSLIRPRGQPFYQDSKDAPRPE